MERLCSVVRSHFKRHWRTIALQINAVNDNASPKRAFLYDCGSITVDELENLCSDLKEKELISKDILIATLKDDIFILNLNKFQTKSSHLIVDISESLNKAEVIKETDLVDEMFRDIDSQLLDAEDAQVINLDIKTDWCIPTIFGYLINYPILYYHKECENCLTFVDLNVHQIQINGETLVSFSVPNELYVQSAIVKEKISKWMMYFQTHDDFTIKTFVACYPTVIL